jgi:hypothetical protein
VTAQIKPPADVLEPPPLRHVASLRVDVGPPLETGQTPAGLRRVIPIIGGRVTGSLLSGRVLPGGADHQLIRIPTETEVEARYVVETDAGELVHVKTRPGRPAPW